MKSLLAATVAAIAALMGMTFFLTPTNDEGLAILVIVVIVCEGFMAGWLVAITYLMAVRWRLLLAAFYQVLVVAAAMMFAVEHPDLWPAGIMLSALPIYNGYRLIRDEW